MQINQNPFPTESPKMIVRTVGRSNNVCCVCGENGLPKQTVTNTLAACVWASDSILVHPKNRTCQIHVQGRRFTDAALELLRRRSSPKEKNQCEMFAHLNDFLTATVEFVPIDRKPPLDFESKDMTDEDYKCYTGLSKADFDNCLSYFGGSLHDSVHRSKRNALAIFLCKLRMDNSQKQLAHLFGIDQQRVSEIFHRVADVLDANFASRHVGFGHISHDEFARLHSRTLATILMDQQPNSCMYVMDGTYFEIESSTNFAVQHDTYSPHKFYNLVKPMVVTGTDGYILEILGLFFGNNNDASILNSMLEEGTEFSAFFEEDDLLILDRGFERSRQNCEANGLKTAMPNLLAKGQSQFDDLQANQSRLVTMLRWVVESTNGRFKMIFKFFRSRISNKYLPNNFLLKLTRIAAAIFNKYFPLIAPNKPGDEAKAAMVKDKAEIRNLLFELIQENGWLNSRTNYVSMEVEQLVDFPRLTIEDLQKVTVGVYQIKVAKSYTFLHVKDGEYHFHIHRELPNLIRVKMASRYRSGTIHSLWIQYRPGGEGHGSITGWYCRCQSGARTLGCCAHIVSVIWYFGIGRHLQNLKYPAENIAANLLDVRTRRQI